MWLEICIGIICVVFLWDYLNKKHRNEVIRKYKIPGPETLPLIGNALELTGLNTENLFDFAKRNKARYGKIYRIWVFHQLSIFILDVKYLEIILSSQQLIKKSSLYDFLKVWLGTGLLLSNGKKWHTRRKIITPTFHFKILEQFVEIFDQQSNIMMKRLSTLADGKSVIDIFPIVCLTALDIITETAMGVKVGAQENPNIDYVKAVAAVTHMMGTRFITPLYRTDWLFRIFASNKHREMMKNIEVMHNFTNRVIEERREELQNSINKDNSNPKDADDLAMGNKKRMALLDVLLQSTIDGKPLSNADIREEVDTFMFEGHDTTTSAISFCLYLISRHPEVQQKIIEEIKEVIGTDRTRAVTLRDLSDMKYLECAIKETLRMYPSVPAVGREVTEDTVVDDVVIPAKTNLSLSLFMALRDPEHFPDPNTFKPERFCLENDVKINPFAYTPFSAGPRNCIGQKFAMLEMKSTISKVLRHFELLSLGPEVRPMINLIVRSANGINIGLKPRPYSEI